VKTSLPALQAKVMVDKYTGRSRGFGFVTFKTSEDATNAIEAMNGQVSARRLSPRAEH
jgi:cold-inducible RNA-binding protein